MEIKICPNCEGQGQMENRSHRGTDTEIVQCQRCYGTGKVMIKTYTVERPFNCYNGDFHEADAIILKTIQNMKL